MKPSRHVSIFPLIAALNLTVVESIQLLLFKWEKDIQMASLSYLMSVVTNVKQTKNKTEIASGELQWACVYTSFRAKGWWIEMEKAPMHIHIIVLRAWQLIFKQTRSFRLLPFSLKRKCYTTRWMVSSSRLLIM